MISTKDIIDNIFNHNNLHTDYKAEVLANNLMKYYDEVEHVFLKRLGSNNRSFNKDIESVTSQVYELGEFGVTIGTYREGIYDYLPEGIFHPPSLGIHHNKIDEVVSQIQKQKKIESHARKFFQPFELESYYLELNALILENEYDITGDSNLLLETVNDLWPLLKNLDENNARIFIYLLPFFHSVRANRRWFEKCLSAFLQIPVEISFVPNRINDIDEVSSDLVLSKFKLGISTILSGSHMDGERNWVIQYGPIPYDDLSNYIPNSNLRKLLDVLYDYCLPVTVKVKEYFVVNKKENSFLLNKNTDASRLGFSTFL